MARKDNFMAGSSLANCIWFNKKKMGFTTRVDFVKNPSRYFSFSPAVLGGDGINAFSRTDPGKLTAKEVTLTYDIMPSDFVVFSLEYLHRSANVPYFAGPGGTTSLSGYAGQPLPVSFQPDLRRLRRPGHSVGEFPLLTFPVFSPETGRPPR